MADINRQTISGDLEVSRNITTGGSARVSGNSEFAGNVKVGGLLDAPNLRTPFKGVFATETELLVSYPRPKNGEIAYVGSMTAGDGEVTPGTVDGHTLYYVMRASGGKWESTGTTDYLQVETDIASVTAKVESLETELGNDVAQLEKDIKENHLSHLAENVSGMVYDDENQRVSEGEGLATNLLLALSGNMKDARLKLVAESLFLETADFEINYSTGQITRKENSPGGSIYLTSPDGVFQRAQRIVINAMQRIDNKNGGHVSNGLLQLFTTYDKDLTHNNSRVICERDIWGKDESETLDNIPSEDKDGQPCPTWALDARKGKELADGIAGIENSIKSLGKLLGDGDTESGLEVLVEVIRLMQNGKWGGSVRFNGFRWLGGEELTEGCLTGEPEGIIWLCDRKMFVAVSAKVVVDCDCEKIVHSYWTDWDGSRFFMSEPGVGGALWKQKVYIHGGAVYVWKECEEQLVKTGGRIENVLSDGDIDEIMENFEFVDVGNPIYKVVAKGDAQLYLEAENNGNEAVVKGKVDIQDITEADVLKMFEKAEKEYAK